MWSTVKLGELCKMYQPKTISAKEMVADGDYVVFGANGIIGRYDKYNHEEPQLLVTCRGATCGAVNVSEPFSWITGNAMVIQPDLEKVSLKYMEYLFRGGINLSTAITGAAQPQITRKSLEPIQFSYPPLAEQQRIVANLDAAFAEIESAIKLVVRKQANAEKLKASLLDVLLTSDDALWKTVKLGDLYDVGSSKRVLKADWQDEGIPFYRGREITALSANGYVDNDLFITEEHYQSLLSKYGVPNVDDIMITAIGTIGNTYIVQPNQKFYFKDASVLWLRKKTDVSSNYMQYWLKSNEFFCQLDKGNGATVDTLTIKKLASVVLPLPPLAEQQRIVAKLDAAFTEIETVFATTKMAIDNYASLKSSLLTRELSPSEAV